MGHRRQDLVKNDSDWLNVKDKEDVYNNRRPSNLEKYNQSRELNDLKNEFEKERSSQQVQPTGSMGLNGSHIVNQSL